jgi:hypothetical protein
MSTQTDLPELVVPDVEPAHSRWQPRLQAVCDAFGVELLTVPERFAIVGQFE